MLRILWVLAFYLPAIVKCLLLFGFVFWPVAMQVQRHASSALRLACDAEFLSETTVCRLIAPRAGGGGADRYTSAIETEFTGLEGLLWGASEVVPLVQGLTEAHLSIDDLIVVVKSSSLDSRATLVEELSAISSEAKDASRNLQKLFAQVQGAVDVMLAVNEHLLQLLQTQISPTSALSMYCYVIGNALYSNECSSSSLRISQAFERTLLQFRQVLSTLILRVVQVQGNLDSIDARLGVVRDLVAMEAGVIMSEKSDVLPHILALLRLPSQRMARLEAQLQSLKEVNRYRAVATRYIAGAFAGLQELEEAMEVLRSMSLGAELIDGVPMEVLIPTFTKGIERVHRAGRLSVSVSKQPSLIPA
ncbi:hypothetical protein BU15DRAFT_82020 [Melanogaster broomeanus]|nr:hypothetical protein BU15DRAFT_82020 [Melanogaster broomeanus]